MLPHQRAAAGDGAIDQEHWHVAAEEGEKMIDIGFALAFVTSIASNAFF